MVKINCGLCDSFIRLVVQVKVGKDDLWWTEI